MSKPKLLIIGVLLVLCVGAVILLFKTPEVSDGFINHTVPNGEFKFAYPSPFYLLADYITSYPEKPVITNELERRELYVQIIKYDKLLATKEDACREFIRLNPGEKCGVSAPLTQEDLQREKIKIDTSSTDTKIESSSKFIGGTITILDGRSSLYSLYYSDQAGIYYVRLSVFTDKGDLIWLEVPLWGIASLDAAKKDARVVEFWEIISTLRFSR
ncbi:MAG: hypothetical protein AAB667_02065 [Patescibacteria group bacterium]